MRQSRFTDRQIVGMILEQVTGTEVSHIVRLKPLENENAKLRHLLDYTLLDNCVLKDMPGRHPQPKTCNPAPGRALSVRAGKLPASLT